MAVTSGKQALRLLVFLGSVRKSTPPSPSRIGERVALYCKRQLTARSHTVAIVDPLERFGSGKDSSFESWPFKPHFAYAPGKAPEELELLAEEIKQAHGYVCVSPEYNHSMSPALAELLNYFGSSLFSYKPSIIVSYSAGQWGGTRAAIAMRPFLSELGCLPVSQMIHVPKAAEVFDAHGKVVDAKTEAGWHKYCGRGWAQLEWWANAAEEQKKKVDPFASAKAFQSSPAQRNAPS